LCLLVAPASAVVHTVTQVGLTFVPEDLTINVGDTVEWVWATGLHTVTSGIDLADPNLGSLFDEPLDSGQPLVSFTFNETGVVPYLCRFHFGFGMTGVIRVATGVTHTIDQVSLTFVPDDIGINVGDTVEWIWSSGTHTVTNGTDFSDPNFGVLFDAPLDDDNPSFSFTFFNAGEVPYFCQPHFSAGMTGIVRVQDPTPVWELPGQLGFALYQNTPNPFNPKTIISYTLLESAPVNLGIYDLSGRLVRTLVNGEVVGSGLQETVWQGRDETGRQVAAGVYFYRLEAGAFSEAKRMTLVK
jgi:plastocyanin